MTRTIKKQSADIALTPRKSDNFVHFRVRGNPTPKARPRRGRGGQFYTPKKTKQYETWVKASFMSVYEPVLDAKHNWEVDIEVCYTKWCGDIDNIMKSLLDGLNGVLWMDDKQVRSAKIALVKVDDNPCVYIKCWMYNKKEK